MAEHHKGKRYWAPATPGMGSAAAPGGDHPGERDHGGWITPPSPVPEGEAGARWATPHSPYDGPDDGDEGRGRRRLPRSISGKY